MSEDPGVPVPEEPEGTPPEPERVRTGVEHVEEVITAVEALEERPLEEHVGVFETAHAELRRALDDTDRPADPA
ncbi:MULTISPECIES: hypothetical protein [unclassified Nocardioides]|uniref:hypothetical protein n=1 Tax=unclassified Nocardioides TaxID=2615069 RepID=UPI0036240B40